MKKVVVIDGQGGKLGRMLIEGIKSAGAVCSIYAIGTNSVATAHMMKAGADFAATGENPVLVNCRDATVVMGPVGIVIADALTGEITPPMAVAVGSSPAKKILLPINRCNNTIVGTQDLAMAELITLAVRELVRTIS